MNRAPFDAVGLALTLPSPLSAGAGPGDPRVRADPPWYPGERDVSTFARPVAAISLIVTGAFPCGEATAKVAPCVREAFLALDLATMATAACIRSALGLAGRSSPGRSFGGLPAIPLGRRMVVRDIIRDQAVGRGRRIANLGGPLAGEAPGLDRGSGGRCR